MERTIIIQPKETQWEVRAKSGVVALFSQRAAAYTKAEELAKSWRPAAIKVMNKKVQGYVSPSDGFIRVERLSLLQ